MTKIMIIGAHGATARIVTDRLLSETQDELVLFLRNAQRLNQYKDNPRVSLVEGDVLNTAELAQAMADVDLVYSNVGGRDLADQTASMLKAMESTKQTRLIFISALGAHHEVPGKFGQWNEQAISAVLPSFRASAKLLEDSEINFTEIRPAWLTNDQEVNYELTNKNEPFKGTEVSRASVADLVVKIIADPTQYIDASLGVNKPNTDGDKPSWM
ncbi:NAD(P)H-binding protein [Companilactobacillus kimchiensis]|uniref:Nad-dependent epimerase dehydratase n=1 Tax=Companilactobacillus kimchiensis TaxID=993692 RepID=A0A0R2LJP9_9LACO|nr:NAD(P)H-binding protein [Companilactobacillus kimchiensis]KRO00123.1 nad-dependent epimerase dehydratase [Companilactobacillus kimchiensis]